MAPMSEAQRRWRQKNIGKVQEHDRNRKTTERAAIPEDERLRRLEAVKKHYRAKGRYRKYGITKEDFDRMMVEQDGKCKTCSRTAEESRNGTLSIDHCHTTGKVRALLCHNCNVTLGLAGDDPAILLALAALIEEKDVDSGT